MGYFGWVRHYFGWVEVRGGVWGIIFGRLGCVGVSGTLFWVGGGEWGIILGGWEWVVMSGGEWG